MMEVIKSIVKQRTSYSIKKVLSPLSYLVKGGAEPEGEADEDLEEAHGTFSTFDCGPVPGNWAHGIKTCRKTSKKCG